MRRIMRSRELAQIYRDPNYFVRVIRERQLIYLNIPSSKLIPILSWSDGVHKRSLKYYLSKLELMSQTILIIQRLG